MKADAISAMIERAHRHQFNDNAVRMTKTLGIPSGLTRLGVHLIRLEPGRDSTQFHYHDSDEEFVYVLEGNGTACIGEARLPIGAGDFMGFPSPSPAHGIVNDSATDLVYLVGGENNPADVVHYPWIRRTMIKSLGERRWVDWDHLHDLS